MGQNEQERSRKNVAVIARTSTSNHRLPTIPALPLLMWPVRSNETDKCTVRVLDCSLTSSERFEELLDKDLSKF